MRPENCLIVAVLFAGCNVEPNPMAQHRAAQRDGVWKQEEEMKRKSDERERAQRAWAKIESLGGDGVWDNDLGAVDLKGCEVSDDDLALFKDLPMVQILTLSDTPISDLGLLHLEGLSKLELLVVANTNVSSDGLNRTRVRDGSKARTAAARRFSSTR